MFPHREQRCESRSERGRRGQAEVRNRWRKAAKQRGCQCKEFIRGKSWCDLQDEDEWKFLYDLIFRGNSPNHTLSARAEVVYLHLGEVPLPLPLCACGWLGLSLSVACCQGQSERLDSLCSPRGLGSASVEELEAWLAGCRGREASQQSTTRTTGQPC